MLSGNESISHYTPANILVWMVMAFQAGILNIGGFMTCHRFVSHVTGFATFFGYEMSQVHYHQAFNMLSVPIFFLMGSMLSGQLVDIQLKQHKKPKYYISFGIVFFLILFILIGGTCGFLNDFGQDSSHFKNYILLAVLCLVCGIQNGTITTVSKSVIRTTHLTGITTDLGIGLVRFLNQKHLHGQIHDEVKANFMRLGIILFFVFGSIIGAFVFHYFGYAGFIIPAISSGIFFLGTLYFQMFHHHKTNR